MFLYFLALFLQDPSQLLWEAVGKGDTAQAAAALSAGADVDATHPFTGNVPLFLAVERRNLELVTLLVQSGADVGHVNKAGFQAIHLAALNNQKAMIELLLKHGAQLESPSKDGASAIHLAARRGHKELLGELKRLGAKLDAEGAFGLTPLMEALQRNDVATTRLLVELGADLAHFDRLGRTPLMLCRDSLMADFFRKHGAGLDFSRQPGPHPLTEAIRTGNQSLAIWLIHAGCSVHATDERGWPALLLARRAGMEAVIDLLLSRGAKELDLATEPDRALLYFSGEGDLERMVQSLERGASASGLDSLVSRPLLEAALHGRAEAVALLLDRGAEIDALDDHGNSAFLLAAASGHLAVLNLLLERGANPMLQNKAELNAHHLALEKSAPAEVIALLQSLKIPTFVFSPCCQKRK
jgi:ankyrin repeat protein